ncbi:hypothetical protein KAFR_0J02570 [Kazachstania africana CBS 2517]|uniref:Uncharacterized protein n=1 Tax=Kazachstania africana (strain ATCC 22294 / BCRC 22015 / CBS 2517 / CECT 1963 / NBRC 1671 / NRRL Y-8276) TaxID=1071382 RepID=H2B121_KAZAF|nr:hypothetical protein KAFR_0J02570 [Kazachstania africana CBS 2517]CCF60321.1 hypothetical protein KAFR_0J02570 [Kazachstania africana CBS 2517]
MSFDHFKTEGNQYFKEGNYASAIKSYEKCIEINPENPIGYSNKAMALIKANKNQEAVRTCQDGLKRVSKNDATHETIQKKLEYRLELAEKALNKEVPKEVNLVENLVIHEVDSLPKEFAGL